MSSNHGQVWVPRSGDSPLCMPSNAWRTRSTSWRSAFSGTDASHELMIAGGVYTTAGGDSAESARAGPDVECVHDDDTSHRQGAGGGAGRRWREADAWRWAAHTGPSSGLEVVVARGLDARRRLGRGIGGGFSKPCACAGRVAIAGSCSSLWTWPAVLRHHSPRRAGQGRLSRCGRPERRGHGARRRAVRERSGRYHMIRGTGHIYDIAKEGEVRCISHEILRRLECRCGSSGRTELQASEK